MARGGAKPGERRGGRKKGTRNKANAAQAEQTEASGETPLAYMLRVMRDPARKNDQRDKMAVAAAPYVHQKLSTMEVTGKGGGALIVEIQRFADRAP